MMSSDDAGMILQDIDQEGFHYTFKEYSDYPEVDDAMFHHLRREYLKAAKALESYINRSRREGR